MDADQTITALTNVSTLTASTVNSNITVIEDNGLGLNLVDAGSGDVNITVNAGNLTDNNAGANNIKANDVTLNVVAGDIGTAANSIETDIDTLAITNAGNAYISEDNGIILNNINVTTLFDLDTSNNGSVTSSAGTKITATSVDINADGAVNINTNITDITVATTNDNVVVNEDNGLAVNTINAGSGDVTLTLTAGAVTDNNAGANNITANLLDVTAPGGINLDTTITTLTADTTGANGDINIDETNGLDLNDVNAGTGNVTLTLAAGSLNSNPGTKISGNLATLTAPGGIDVNTNISTLTATTTNSAIKVTEDNTLALNDINAGTGDIEFVINAGTLTSNAGTSINGDDLKITGAGAIDINTDVTTLEASTTDANITVDEDNDLALNLIDAGTGDIDIEVGIVTDGALTDNNGGQKNIIGNNVVLTADNGIGSGDALETTMNTLTAANTNNGIEIDDEGGLTIVAPGIANTNGLVNITTHSPLNVNANVTAGGDINLTAGDNDAVTTDNLAIAAGVNVQSTGGDVTLQAGDDITQAAGSGVISAGGGDIYLYAGHDNDGDGLINMQAVVGSGAETLAMKANQGITVTDAELTTINAFNSDSGNITITANTTTSRTLTIDDVVLGTGFGIKNNNGDVTITNNGTIDIPGTNIPTWPAGAGIYGNNITLSANGTGSDILLASTGTGTIIIGIYANGTVNLTADDDITAGSVGGSNNGNTADIVASKNITLNATNGDITIGGDNNNAYSGVISTTETVNMTAGNNININSNCATGTVIQAANTVISLPGYAVSLNAGGNINFAAVNTSIDAGNAPVHLVAGGSITDNNTNIDIVGGDLVAEGGVGIGSGNAIETKVSRLAARVTTGNGNIEFENITGDLTLDDLVAWGYAVNNAGTGNINITVNSNLTVDDPVNTHGGNVTFSANSGGIFQNANGDVNLYSAGGSFTATAAGPYWMNDNARVYNARNITITAAGDITLGNLNTYASTSIINLTSTGGRVVDGGDTYLDIEGQNLRIDARDGVGTAANQIDTHVVTAAINSSDGGVFVNETDNLEVNTVAGTTGITAHGDIDLDIGDNLTLAADTPTADNEINSNGGGITIDADDVTQNDGADILSSGTPTDGDITLNIRSLYQGSDSKIDAGSANVDINASGSVALDEINGHIVDISAGNNIEEYAPDPDTDITAYDLLMTASTGIGNNDALETKVSRLNVYNSTSGNIDIHNTEYLTIDDIGLGQVVTAPDGNNYTIGVGNDGGDITIQVASSIYLRGPAPDIAVYTAGGNVTLTASDDILAGSTTGSMSAIETFGGDVTLTAGRNVYLGDQGNYADINWRSVDNSNLGGEINITAGWDITVDNYTWVWGVDDDINFTAGNDINIITRATNFESNVYTSGTGDINLNATNDVNIIGGIVDSEAGNISITAGNDVNTSASAVIASYGDGDISILGTNDVNITDSVVEGLGAGDITITATNGDVVIGLSVVSGNDGNVTITASAGDVYILDNSIVTTIGTGSIDITGNQDVYITDSGIDSGDKITIEAENNDVEINSSTLTAQEEVEITGDDDVKITSSTLSSANSNVNITATNDDVDISGSNIVADNNITIEADDNVDITDGWIDAGNNMNITANTGYVTIDPTILQTGNNMKIQAATDVNIVQSILDSEGDIGIQATANDINISGSTLTAADDTQLFAGNDIIISSDSTSTSEDDATLTAGGNVEIGYVEAANKVGIEAGGRIFDNNGDAVNITAQEVVLLADSGIGYTTGYLLIHL